MKMDKKYFLDHKLDYLKLAAKIYEIRCHGDEPPKELLQLAHKLGHLANIPEEELKNL